MGAAPQFIFGQGSREPLRALSRQKGGIGGFAWWGWLCCGPCAILGTCPSSEGPQQVLLSLQPMLSAEAGAPHQRVAEIPYKQK